MLVSLLFGSSPGWLLALQPEEHLRPSAGGVRRVWADYIVGGDRGPRPEHIGSGEQRAGANPVNDKVGSVAQDNIRAEDRRERAVRRIQLGLRNDLLSLLALAQLNCAEALPVIS